MAKENSSSSLSRGQWLGIIGLMVVVGLLAGVIGANIGGNITANSVKVWSGTVANDGSDMIKFYKGQKIWGANDGSLNFGKATSPNTADTKTFVMINGWGATTFYNSTSYKTSSSRIDGNQISSYFMDETNQNNINLDPIGGKFYISTNKILSYNDNDYRTALYGASTINLYSKPSTRQLGKNVILDVNGLYFNNGSNKWSCYPDAKNQFVCKPL